MSDHQAPFSEDEERLVRMAAANGGAAQCPICAVTMTRRSLGGGSFGLGYSRHREWLLCPQCRRSVLFDERRGTRN